MNIKLERYHPRWHALPGLSDVGLGRSHAALGHGAAGSGPQSWPRLFWRRWLYCAPAVLILAVAAVPLQRLFAAAPPEKAVESPPPESPREFFNTGTQKLKRGKLREAEAFLQTALAAQQEKLQPPALYNLGHVRFGQGVEELKKGPPAGPTAARGRAAAQAASDAIGNADQALAGTDVQKLVDSYLRGRGARRALREAIKAVRRAMDVCGTTLSKWERASGDFKSALELQPSDAEARQNAETVDRCIARLVDSIRELQQAAAFMDQKKDELGDKIKQLKGRIPEEDMPPGAPGDEEEEEDQPKGTQPEDKEGPSKQGEEMTLAPELASWLLESFKLDTERRLPMGQKDTAEPKDRSRKPW